MLFPCNENVGDSQGQKNNTHEQHESNFAPCEAHHALHLVKWVVIPRLLAV
jgi:hypothetical protein